MLNRVYKASPSIYNPTPVTHLASYADYSIAHSAYYSKLVYASDYSPFLLRRWIGSLRISTPGPTLLESFRRLGKILVPDHPNLNATSCAMSSPKPSIKPLMNGSSRLIAAPRIRPQRVGGEYRMRGELEDEGGDDESSWLAS